MSTHNSHRSHTKSSNAVHIVRSKEVAGKKFREFKPAEMIPRGARILCLGPSESGKTSALLFAISEMCKVKTFHYAIVLATANIGLNCRLQKEMKVPDSYFFTEWDGVFDRALTGLFSTMEQRFAKGHTDEEALIFLDDVSHYKAQLNSAIMQKVLTAGRNFGITIAFSGHYSKLIMPEKRDNVNIVIMTFESKRASMRKLHEAFCGYIDSYHEFEKIYTTLCSKIGQALVVSSAKLSRDIESHCLWYNYPKSVTPFRVGCEAYWKFHAQNYDKQWKKNYASRKAIEDAKQKTRKRTRK
jgi:hypothetical protein